MSEMRRRKNKKRLIAISYTILLSVEKRKIEIYYIINKDISNNNTTTQNMLKQEIMLLCKLCFLTKCKKKIEEYFNF